MEANSQYCSGCCNSQTDPSLIFDEKGVCNICQKGTMQATVDCYKTIAKNTEEYEKSLERTLSESEYHCLLMLSGGKDSIYILNELLENGKKPLVYTLNHPFASGNARENLERVKSRLHFDYYDYFINKQVFSEALRTAFTSRTDKTSIEHTLKRPCYICGNIIILSGFTFALRFGIPYYLYCADPMQMLGLPQTVKEALELLLEYLGRDFAEKIVPGPVVDRILNNDTEGLPQIVYPYSNRKYNPMQIMAKLRKEGLYETSPVETHCQLLSLLNYYSIKRYDTFFYSHELAAMVRSKMIPRDKALAYLEEYKDILMHIAPGDNAGEAESERVRRCLKFQYKHEGARAQLEYELENILSLPRIAEKLGLRLDEI